MAVNLDCLHVQLLRRTLKATRPNRVPISAYRQPVATARRDFEFEFLQMFEGLFVESRAGLTISGSSPSKMRFDRLIAATSFGHNPKLSRPFRKMLRDIEQQKNTIRPVPAEIPLTSQARLTPFEAKSFSRRKNVARCSNSARDQLFRHRARQVPRDNFM